MKEVSIRVEKLEKSFRENKVLQGVTFSCKSGEIVGFVGYNGCGKSVLFKCICGFVQPDAGTVSISCDDARIEDISGKIGIIIEEPAFLSNKSGMKNLEFLYGIRNKVNRMYLQSVMELVGLDPLSKKQVRTYSLGMKQRLAIAQAIMEDPPILILDEPMNGLDKTGVAEMRKLFLELKRRGKVILLASHNREDIEVLCDCVYEMEDGRLCRLKE